MRIFVLGRSHTGKTPFARRTAEALAIAHVGASAWVRELFPTKPDDAAERARQVDAMTKFATEQLRREPNVSVASLRSRLAPDAHAVIEGMRNPYDFTCTFDPRTDHAVFLEHSRGEPPPSHVESARARPSPNTSTSPSGTHLADSFERGIDVIRAYLAWLEGADLLDAGRVHVYRFGDYGAIGDPKPDTLEHAIVDFIARTRVPAPQPVATPARVHAQIPPIHTQVRAEYLYDMDPARVGQWRRCTAFTVSSYVGNAPSFQILLEDGAVFSYVPPNALGENVTEPVLELADLAYHDCKSVEIAVQSLDALRGPVLAYFKRRDLWLAGTYLFTIDWYTGNEMLHCVSLANGQYALLPSHKLKFGDHPPGFEPYKKLRREWVTGQ